MFALLFICPLTVWQSYDETVIQAITPETWRVAPAISRAHDAIILSDYTRISINHIDRYRRVLVLNEMGRAAAELSNVSDEIRQLKGRVTTRAGTVTTFNQKNDLVEVLAARTRRSQSRARFLLPPGLSNHCIVDMSWRLPANSGVPKGSVFWRQDIAESFPCQRKVIELTRGILRGTFDEWRTRFIWSKGNGELTFSERKKRGSHYLIFEQIPAGDTYPFGNRHYHKNRAFFLAYQTFRYGGNSPDTFWKMFATRLLKESYEFRFNGTPEYKTWLAELKKQRKPNPYEALLQVYAAFRERVAHAKLLPPRLQSEPGSQQEETIAGKRMNQVFRQGYGFDGDLSRLFLQVLRDLEIPAKLVFSTPLDQGIFEPSAMNWFDLPLNQPMFGLPLQDRHWLLVKPTSPEYSPGFVPSKLRFGQALVVDPFDEWAHGIVALARYGASDHRRYRDYQSEFAVDQNIGSLSFAVTEKGSGAYNARFKRWFFPYPSDEHGARLRAIWEKRSAAYHFAQASVTGGDRLDGTVVMAIEGRRQFEAMGQNWVSINPFPGDTLPLSVPNHWPANRNQPIFLAHQLMQTDLNQITVPQGWVFRGEPSWRKSNQVGEVVFSVSQVGRVIKVRRDIVIKDDFLPADAEPELKDFIAWMEEAGYQTLGLQRGPPL